MEAHHDMRTSQDNVFLSIESDIAIYDGILGKWLWRKPQRDGYSVEAFDSWEELIKHGIPTQVCW